MFVGLGVFVGVRVLVGIEVAVGVLAAVAVSVLVGVVVEVKVGVFVGRGVSVSSVDVGDGVAHPTRASETMPIEKSFFPMVNSLPSHQSFCLFHVQFARCRLITN